MTTHEPVLPGISSIKAASAAVVSLLALGVSAAATVHATEATHVTHTAAGASVPAGRTGREVAQHSGQPPASAVVSGAQGGAVGEAIRSGGRGYWAAYPNGAVSAASPAPALGDMSGTALSQRVVGVAGTPDGGGYWMVARDGGIFSFGDAAFYGSTGGMRLNQPVVGMASTPDGRGYWLVASDGGIFTFGDAGFYGSTGGMRLNQPVVAMAATSDARGYWLGARDGGVFTFGDAEFHGSAVDLFASFGERAVSITGYGTTGYWIGADSGNVAAMNAPLMASSVPPSGPSAAGGGGNGKLPVGQDPSQSTPPSNSFNTYCFGASYSPSACDQAALADINSALSGEGYGSLALPSNYSSLSTESQLVAVANAERSGRGLPVMPENTSLDVMAFNGARNGQDPTGPSGYTWGSNLAMGYPTALSADYVWMYDDGANSPNVDCPSPGAAGCWGHRHNVLIQGSGHSGGGSYNNNGTLNLTQLFAVNY